jgi:phosphate transport system ATP-binding protein
MTEAILQVRKFDLFYGEKQALFDINMDFFPNEITALIGPSGCGKTTLLRSINRMNDLIETVKITGSIIYKNGNIYSSKVDTVDLRKEIGMVFQQPNPFPFSIYENVVYGLRLKGERDKSQLDEAVETSLKAANIWDEVKDKLHSSALGLSGGQQQRVCIARVLAVKPDIILLDEPTSALDPISSGRVEETLLELKENYTMVIVTHNMQQASRISDRTAFMLNGNLIEYEDTKSIFLNPQKQETEDYVAGKFG